MSDNAALIDNLKNWRSYGASGMGKTIAEVTQEAAATIRDLQARLEQAERERDAAIHLVQRYDVVAHKIEAERDEARALLREAGEVVKWYGENARLCRLIHSGGDTGRHNLSGDGGSRARAFLDKLKENADSIEGEGNG